MPMPTLQRPRSARLGLHRHYRRAALVLAAALGGCATVTERWMSTPQGEQTQVEVAVTREAVLPGDPATVFAFITAEGVLPQVLTGYGLLPAVVGTSGHSGPWDQPGSARVVHLADGSSVREQVTALQSPHHFAYRVWDFGNPVVRRLAEGAVGVWRFEPVSGGTRVVWTYTFTARNNLTALPLAAITRLQWRGYMDVCLDNSRRLLLVAAQAPQARASAHAMPVALSARL
jgi:Polyketide cyclase / dehydrase and lipid transport